LEGVGLSQASTGNQKALSLHWVAKESFFRERKGDLR
jgi:hypothetical protein